MLVYRRKSENYIRYSLAVDPGQKTMGCSLLDLVTGEHYFKGFSSNIKPLESSMGEITIETNRRIREVDSWIRESVGLENFSEIALKRSFYENLQLVIEHTTTSFSFSAGILSCIQSFITFLNERGCEDFVFVQPQIPNWFAKMRKVPQSMSKKIVLSQFPEYKDLLPRTVGEYAHIADAICMNIYVNYDNWPERTFNLRKPLYKEIKI